MSENQRDTSETEKILTGERRKSRRRRFWFWAALSTSAAAAVVLFLVFYAGGDRAGFQYVTEEARRGDITVTVTATGTLEPVTQVEVGIEVSGTIETVKADFNDRVKKGELLAMLDTEKLEAQAQQSEAALELARAKLVEAQATVLEKTSDLDRVRRVRELTGGKVPSLQDLDSAEATVKRALAGEANARAQISEAEARLGVDRTNLEKAAIRSPIDGIVLKRQIEPGQTVAASLQTPVLFILAENLTQMELHVAVDEADVGQVREGQRAAFTVDAYPDRTFPAVITEARYSPQTVEGVVTYETVMSVDNSDLSLRPGMTATAEIIVNELKDVVLVPNAALRFTPPDEQAQEKRGFMESLLPGPRRRAVKRQAGADKNAGQRVWTLREGAPVALPVRTGATDGRMTELVSGEVEPGVELLVDTVSAGK